MPASPLILAVRQRNERLPICRAVQKVQAAHRFESVVKRSSPISVNDCAFHEDQHFGTVFRSRFDRSPRRYRTRRSTRPLIDRAFRELLADIGRSTPQAKFHGWFRGRCSGAFCFALSKASPMELLNLGFLKSCTFGLGFAEQDAGRELFNGEHLGQLSGSLSGHV